MWFISLSWLQYIYILGTKFQAHGSWHCKGNQIVKVTNDDFRVLDYVYNSASGNWPVVLIDNQAN